MQQTFDIRTERRLQVVSVTGEVGAAPPRGYGGVCTAFSTHTTTGICVSEAESRLPGDIESMLTEVVPGDGWDHNELDGNADSYLRAFLVDNGVSMLAVDGILGPGQ